MNKFNARILIADDDAISIHVLQKYLTDAGYEVIAVADGQQAWSLLQESPENFNLLIMDRVMPHLHGIDVVKQIQNNTLLKKTPVIMITGVAEKEEIIEAITAGVFDFLYKPIEKELLLAVVKKALQS